MLKDYIKRIVKEEFDSKNAKFEKKLGDLNLSNDSIAKDFKNTVVDISDLRYHISNLEAQNENLAKLLDSAVVKMNNAHNGYVEINEELKTMRDFINRLAILVAEKSPKIKRTICKDTTTKKKYSQKTNAKSASEDIRQKSKTKNSK